MTSQTTVDTFYTAPVGHVAYAAKDQLEVVIELRGTDLATTHEVPGQYVKLRLPGDEKAGFFALASPPGGGNRFQFLIKTGTALADRLAVLKANDLVELTAAQGKGFPIREHAGKQLLLFAAGTGISAIRSLVWYVLNRRADYGDVTLFYGVQTPSHFAYQDDLAVWERRGVRVVKTISRPDPSYGWPGARGYVQDHLAEDIGPPERCALFICGPKAMSEGLAARLNQLGLHDQSLLTNF